jgi:hypothetical protein
MFSFSKGGGNIHLCDVKQKTAKRGFSLNSSFCKM